MAEDKALDVETGEMLPAVITPASAPMKLVQMSEMIGYMEKFTQELLKTKVDFGVIPGTKKPTLYKAGAEKLCMAFGLSEEYEVIASQREPFKEWEYTVDGKTKKTRGYYYFSVRCNLIHKGTGVIWASQIGDCESTERGRETAPSNTILKMAQKRAFVGATLHATFTSDRFTADMDTYKQSASKGQPKGKPATAPDEIPTPSASATSKYGTPEKKTKCNFCGKCHTVKGDPIVQHPGPGDLEGKWGHANCYAGLFREAKNESPAESEQAPDKPTDSPDPAREELLKEIPELERKYTSLYEDFKPLEEREAFFRFRDLTQADDDMLVRYRYILNSTIEKAQHD